MKILKNLILLTLFGSSLCNIANAQDLLVDLKKMSQAYQEATTLSSDLEVKIYKDDNLEMTKRAKIKRDKNRYFYSLGGVIFLVNDKYSLMINDLEKVIIFKELDKIAGNDPSPVDQFNIEQMDSLFRVYDNWRYEGIKKDGKHYVINNSNGLINQINLFLNPENYTIQKIIYNYNEILLDEKSTVVIEYKALQINPKFSDYTFSENQYIKKFNGNWLTTQTYKSYELFNASATEN